MKKSMIISTIAMIVVVVVALSTATYAWFAAAGSVKATTTVTATSDADWMISSNTLTIGETNTLANTLGGTWSGLTTEVDFSSNYSMKGNLYSPTGVLDAAFATASTSAVPTANKFYMATTNNSVTKQSDAAAADMAPMLIRLTNVSQAPKNLTVKVTVTTATTNAVDQYALAATCIYLKGTYGSTPETCIANTSYSHRAEAGANTEFSGSEATQPKAGFTQEKPSYDTTYSDGAKPAAWTEADSKYSYVYEATNLVQVPGNNTSIYFVAYVWLDGWKAEAQAANGSLTVTFEFLTGTEI